MNAWVLTAMSPVVGSFLACAAQHIPERRPPWAGTTCPHCGRPPGPAELVPLLPWLLGRNRCGGCGTPRPPLHPALELGAVAVALASIGLLEGWRLYAGCGFGWALLLLAAIDLRCRRLPDVLTMPLLAAGLLVALSHQADQFADRALAAALGWLGAAMLAATWARVTGVPGLGGGDFRLLAAAGAWLGPELLAWTVLLAAVGGLAATTLLGGRGGWAAGASLPFGPFVAVAAWGLWLGYSTYP